MYDPLRLSAFAAFLLLIVACRPAPAGEAPAPTLAPTAIPATATPPPTATARPPATPTATLAPSATPTSRPDPLTFLPEPILRSAAGENRFLDAGAVFFHDGKYHMFYNHTLDWPQAIEVGYAVSEDGREWQMAADEPVLVTGAAPRWDNLFPYSGLVEPDGRWVLYMQAYRDGTTNSVVARATAPGPLGPWEVSAEPVLDRGPSGAWDAYKITTPAVLRTADGYLMIYAGYGNYGNSAAIGLATSPDGVTWTKYDDPATDEKPYAASDPILTAGGAAWEQNQLDYASVVRDGDGFLLLYRSTLGFSPSTTQLGLARSGDGRDWQRLGEGPIFAIDAIEGLPIAYIPRALRIDHHLHIYLEAGSTSHTDLYLALYELAS